MRLILASTSPRRREILALLGIPFEVVSPRFEERPAAGRGVEKEVLEFAVAKAASVAADHPGSVVIGGDTMIVVDGKKIGKPAGIEEARAMLRSLSGKTHRILTSVAILDDTGGPGLKTVEEVEVRMRDFSDEEIRSYLALNESLDKAGAYSIQEEGRALIESIRGDYLAAVGLPLRPIAGYLESRGAEMRLDVERLYAERSFLNWRSFQT